MKFGGSLAADAPSIRRVAQIILAESLAWRRMVVVVSAMAGATDTLAYATELAANRDGAGYRKVIAALRTQHIRVIETLFPAKPRRDALLNRIDCWLFDALTVCDSVASKRDAAPRDRDAAMVVGEQIMTEILTALVQQEGLRSALVDSASLIMTDDHYQNANPLSEGIEERVEANLKPLLAAGMVALTSGFIGATRKGVMTTLGRGGSDYTATLLAAALRADEVWMWTHVEGIMSADPGLVPNPRVIDVLSYDEIRELSYFGVRLLHPRAIEPLIPNSIPMRVRSPRNAEHSGTLIQAEPSSVGLKAVSAIDGLLLSTRQGGIDLPEFLAQVNHTVGQAATGPVIVMSSQSGATVVFVVPTSEGPQAAANAVSKLTANLPTPRWKVQAVKVIAAMGASASITAASGVTPLAYAHGPGNRSLFVVASEDMHSAVRQLHRMT